MPNVTPRGVRSVTADSTPACTDATAKPSGSTFTCTWDTTTKPNGPHTVTAKAYDLASNSAVSSAVSIPVIASGGAGTFAHFLDVFTRGRADAALAASIFHFSEHAVADLKTYLHDRGVPMRR